MNAAPVSAFVGLGSNLGDPRRQIARARQAMRQIPQTRLVRVSADYLSAPLGPQDQPDFVNAVALLETTLAAAGLLDALQHIERTQGRARGERWGPRTLDLDLLLYDELQLRTADLTLPHPEMHRRAFVLVPLHEIAPLQRIPGRGAVRDLLRSDIRDLVRRLPDDGQH